MGRPRSVGDTDLARYVDELIGNRQINEVADEAGVSRHTIQRWLKGDTKQPDRDAFHKVLESLKVDREGAYRRLGLLPADGKSSAQGPTTQPDISAVIDRLRAAEATLREVREELEAAPEPVTAERESEEDRMERLRRRMAEVKAEQAEASALRERRSS